jgi:hypothetical protein
MNARELKLRILPALLAGTRREALPQTGPRSGSDAGAALRALSLTGQALRFETPLAPEQFVRETWPEDNRPIVPDDVRALLLRLLSAPKCSNVAESAVAWAFACRKVRPHPFDLPRMNDFVSRHAEHLGVVARHWTQRQFPAEKQTNYFDAEEISEQNWSDAPPALRAKFLEGMRARDASAGRNLLLAAWAGESADVRLRLLSVMQTELSHEDKPFLETAMKDRAPRVKSLAQRLLARLAGSAGENPALAACLERIERTKTGVLKKRASLKLQLPATVKERNASRWVMEQFADVGLDEVACALELPIEGMVEAATKDEHLLFAFAMMASHEKNFDVLVKIAIALPDAWGRMSEAGFDDMNFANDGERNRWVESLVHPHEWMPESAFPAWQWLLQRMEGPMPPSVMKGVFALKWWQKQYLSEDKPGAEEVQLFCALCPHDLRSTLRDQLQVVDLEAKELGCMLLDILDRLEILA